LDEGEITAIAAFQGMAESDFIERFTRLQVNRQGLALIDKPGGECIFYEANGCAIQPVKPRQCVDFPEKWNFPGFKSLCQAVWYAE
jgi:Fe-S-cluster containining protein